MVQGGVGLLVQFLGQDGALYWSHQWFQSPVEIKVSGRGMLGQSQSGTGFILFNP